MKLDILVLAAHPDDAELGCGGTLIKHKHLGYKVGVVDLTRGERGTRGTPEIRLQEADEAARIMDLDARENLKFDDAFFANDQEHQMEVIRILRKYKPDILITNATRDRHPDHGRACELVLESVFKSGLPKIETSDQGVAQEAWRPQATYHFIQSTFLVPDLVVDITGFWDQKMEAVNAYRSQFFNENSQEPDTFISSPEFMKLVESRAIEFGKSIGVQHGEGFLAARFPGINDLKSLI